MTVACRGQTILDVAIENGNVEVVRALFKVFPGRELGITINEAISAFYNKHPHLRNGALGLRQESAQLSLSSSSPVPINIAVIHAPEPTVIVDVEEKPSMQKCGELLNRLYGYFNSDSALSVEVRRAITQLNAIHNLFSVIEKYEFPASAQEKFVGIVYAEISNMIKERNFTAERVKKLYENIFLVRSDLLKSADEAIASKIDVSELAIIEKTKEISKNESDAKDIEDQQVEIAHQKQTIESFSEQLDKIEKDAIKEKRKNVLGDIQVTIDIVKELSSTQIAVEAEPIATSIAADLSEMRVEDDEVKKAVDAAVVRVNATQSEIEVKIATCDKEIENIRVQLADETKETDNIREFIQELEAQDAQMALNLIDLEDEKHHKAIASFSKILLATVEGLKEHCALEQAGKKSPSKMLLEMEKRNIIHAIEILLNSGVNDSDLEAYKSRLESSLQNDKEKHSKDNAKLEWTAKNYASHSLKQEIDLKGKEKSILKNGLNTLKETCSAIKDKVIGFFTAISRIRSDSEVRRNAVSVQRSLLEQKQDKLKSERDVLQAKKAVLEGELERLKQQNKALISERKRLETIIHEPFQLILIAKFESTLSSYLGTIKGDAIVLDDNDRAYLIINGKLVLNSPYEPKILYGIERGEIPRFAAISAHTGFTQTITDYKGACAIMENVALREGYSLLYDTKAQRAIEENAVKLREVQEKAVAARRESEQKIAAAKEAEERRSLEERANQQREAEKQKMTAAEKQKMAEEAKQKSAEEAKQKAALEKRVELMGGLKERAIIYKESKDKAVNKQIQNEFGALTFVQIATASQNRAEEKKQAASMREQLTTRVELEQEQLRLQAELKKLEGQYKMATDYNAGDYYSADIERRIQFRDKLCPEIQKLINELIDSPMRREIGRILAVLQKDDSLCTPELVACLDKLATVSFSFVESAELSDLNMVARIVTIIFPLLEEKNEDSSLSQFRETDEANRRVRKALNEKPGQIAEVKREIDSIKQRLEDLKQQENEVEIHAFELDDFGLEAFEPQTMVAGGGLNPSPTIASEEPISDAESLTAKANHLRAKIETKEKERRDASSVVRESQNRRKEKLQTIMDSFLNRIELCHKRMQRLGEKIPAVEYAIIVSLQQLKERVEKLNAQPENAEKFFMEIKAIKEAVMRLKEKVQDSRGLITRLQSNAEVNNAYQALLDTLEKNIAHLPDERQLGIGSSIPNLNNFADFRIEIDAFQKAVREKSALQRELDCVLDEIALTAEPVDSAPLSPAVSRPSRLYTDRSNAPSSPTFFHRIISNAVQAMSPENMAKNFGQSVVTPIEVK